VLRALRTRARVIRSHWRFRHFLKSTGCPRNPEIAAREGPIFPLVIAPSELTQSASFEIFVTQASDDMSQ